jgi:hypothetical protein
MVFSTPCVMATVAGASPAACSTEFSVFSALTEAIGFSSTCLATSVVILLLFSGFLLDIVSVVV